ncbi:hypothetical protein LK10_05420 [Sinomonas humi]|uniref:Uncharacterized protein n=1 Tax=Sinomonas humi TaxID=1338436 RepID=A0A0B2ALG4_9MICC|nr:hypothetical protein LK10_05420 [Sinomonas humi]
MMVHRSYPQAGPSGCGKPKDAIASRKMAIRPEGELTELQADESPTRSPDPDLSCPAKVSFRTDFAPQSAKSALPPVFLTLVHSSCGRSRRRGRSLQTGELEPVRRALPFYAFDQQVIHTAAGRLWSFLRRLSTADSTTDTNDSDGCSPLSHVVMPWRSGTPLSSKARTLATRFRRPPPPDSGEGGVSRETCIPATCVSSSGSLSYLPNSADPIARSPAATEGSAGKGRPVTAASAPAPAPTRRPLATETAHRTDAPPTHL